MFFDVWVCYSSKQQSSTFLAFWGPGFSNPCSSLNRSFHLSWEKFHFVFCWNRRSVFVFTKKTQKNTKMFLLFSFALHFICLICQLAFVLGFGVEQQYEQQNAKKKPRRSLFRPRQFSKEFTQSGSKNILFD